jgi:hypothetical protein
VLDAALAGAGDGAPCSNRLALAVPGGGRSSAGGSGGHNLDVELNLAGDPGPVRGAGVACCLPIAPAAALAANLESSDCSPRAAAATSTPSAPA